MNHKTNSVRPAKRFQASKNNEQTRKKKISFTRTNEVEEKIEDANEFLEDNDNNQAKEKLEQGKTLIKRRPKYLSLIHI